MAIPCLNLTEKSFDIQIFKMYPKNSTMKLKAFRPILSSIFLYFIILCVFRFSHLTFPCTTKFWFFIANTLILIIAADFDAFSSSEKQEYISRECGIKNNMRLADMNVETTTTTPPDEKYYSMVSSANDDGYQNLKPEATEKETKQEDDSTENPEEESVEKMKDLSTTDQEVENERISTIAQETFAHVTETWEGGGVESLSDQIEEDEFSSMSVEELNTRAEEFIRRIHRQIRLQVLVDNRKNLLDQLQPV
ncbi:uncharacterized protein LOC142548023 [Primulina tabacum]|uniref:uncharacterized protein LOC142548023 n=1 Tax=Primulina tabacum TaxID=48773 RepID=UPI003F5A2A69